ncbi:calcium-translocating P-type ATPase, SERCA-type [Candidatus Woesearchaeota archaeon]|nr:MAG: calcium-translocating P-type ATPase, SERCA-type [Candidatus Woesearchaeota archaeon]
MNIKVVEPIRFYDKSSEEVLKLLRVHKNIGLTAEEVQKRRSVYGLNELRQEKKISPLLIFLGQFKSFIIYILLFALAVSVISGEYIDATVILAILLINAVFGFIQEYKAEKAIEELKKLTGLKANVIRSGAIARIDAKELVPGDIILVEEGSKISADCRIIESSLLQVQEASLTGESAPVEKTPDALKGDLVINDQKNMLFAGTIVTRGRAKAVVVKTGMETQIGKIAGMISSVEKEATPLQKKLEVLGKRISLITIIICVLVFTAGIIKDKISLSGGIFNFILASKEWLLTAVSLAVAAVPEGLPAVVTIALAIGTKRMLKRNALVRRLPCVEALGEATVICTDKTGTITRNEMTVRVAYTNAKQFEISGNGYEPKGKITCAGNPIDEQSKLLFKIGVLCNNASLEFDGSEASIIGDPTEAALLVSAEKAGLRHDELLAEWKRIDEKPFDSVRKMMSTVNKDPKTSKEYVFVKGAPEKVLEKCDRIIINNRTARLTPSSRKIILEKNNEFSRKGLRVLGFAYKEYKKGDELEKNLVFVGLQGMIDPPHKEVKESIKRCKEAGIRVIMITGDNRLTAEAIAKEVGIEGKSIEGSEFQKLSEREKIKIIDETNIFARVEPQHKMLIVDLLQKKGEIVAMTGDGVNDAPALKSSDLGIAMGINGTDVTKEASDMILQDDNFASIVNAVEEGRGIYENIKKFVNYLLSSNIAEVLVIFFAILFGWPLPMTAVMLLWLNLVTDGLPALALSVDPNPPNIMKQPPSKKIKGVMGRQMFFQIISVSILITIGTLALFFWSGKQGKGIGYMQTVAFTALIVMELVRLQMIRSGHKLSVFSNKWLIIAVMLSLGLQLLVIYTPLKAFFGTTTLALLDWVMIVGASAVVFVLSMTANALFNKIKQ